MKSLRLASHLVALCVVLAFLGMGAGVPNLSASLRGAVFVLAVPFLFVLATSGPSEIAGAFSDAFGGDLSGADPQRLHRGRLVFQGLGRFSLALGVLGCFWACVAGLQALAMSRGAPEPHQLSPWLAQGFFLPAFGALLRWFVWGPLAERMDGALESVEGV